MTSAADNAQERADDRAVERRLRQALAVWVVGLLVYLLAVFHRSSLAVAGLAAAERFDIGASQLATFTMLQLLVYAGDADPGRACWSTGSARARCCSSARSR